MAINLNPGADATLVNAAYKAALGNTPADYSETLEKAAESYGKTMEASSKMWSNIAQVGAAIGGEMMANAQELTDMVALGATLNPEDAEMFTNEIYGIKDELSALGTFGGKFGDRDTRKKRASLKIKQQELFAEIDSAVENLKIGADAISAGTFDTDIAGLKDKETINAIIKSNLKNKFTEERNMAKLGRDPRTGELVYTLYREDGNKSEYPVGSGEPVTMTLKQFNESIATNVKDGGAMKTAFGKFTEEEANAGNNALNSTYDPERKQMTLNRLDVLLGDKPVDLKRAMRTPVGYSNTSFYDDLTSNSTLSAELYSTLVGVTGDESGELTGAVVDGIEDTDGSGGISAREIKDSENYNVLVGNITGLKDAKVSKEFFKEYAVKQMEEAYKYGHSKKAPVAGTGLKTDTNPYGIPKDGLRLGTPMPNGYRIEVRQDLVTSYINDIKSGTKFEFRNNKYTYVDGGWVENEGGMFRPGEPATEFKIGDTQSLTDRAFENGGKYFDGLVTEEQIDVRTGKVVVVDGAKEDSVKKGLVSKYSTPSLRVDMNFMNNDDNYIGANLNKLLPSEFEKGNENGYKFEVDKLEGSIFALLGEDPFRNAVALKDNEGNVLFYPDGHEYEGKNVVIKTGGNIKERKQAIATLNDILETFGFDKYINADGFEL